MKGGLRKSMTWLHTWSTITAGWILFAIFVTGTLSFFRYEINYWMQPELHEAAPNPQAVDVAYDYLIANAPASKQWQIQLPDDRTRTLSLYWDDPNDTSRRRGPRAQLDPSTGKELTPRDTAGGNFLYRFHFELYGMPRDVAYWIVGVVSMMMLIGIISGVIMHRKIFADFFLFRPKKKLVSWIDGHAITSVLALPFHLFITFSGILLIAGVLLPWNGEGGHRQRGERNAAPPAKVVERHYDATPPFSKMMADAEQAWGVPVQRISIENPGLAKLRYTLSGPNREEISAGRGGNTSFVYNAAGERIKVNPANTADNTAQAIYNYMDMLHQARFADTTTRWLLFFAGVLGSIMVGSGSILWAVKRSKQQMGETGYEFVRGLNVGSIAGFMCACGAYFWANRLLGGQYAAREGWEIATFFIVWLLTFIAGFIWRDRYGWVVQLSFAALLFSLIPVLDSFTSSANLWHAISTLDWPRLSFDILALLTAATLWFSVYYLLKIKDKKRKAPTRKKPAAKRVNKPLKPAAGEA